MLAGQILIKILAFAFSILVVRRLGPNDFGEYSAAMAYAFILAMLSDWGTSTWAVREMARQPETHTWIVPNAMALRALLSVLVIIGTTLSAWILGKPPDMVLGIFIASLALLLYAFQGPLESVLIAHERLDLSAAFNVLNQITFMALGTLALVGGAGYLGLLGASLAGVLVMGGACAWTIHRVLHLQFARPTRQQSWQLLVNSIPFGIIGIVSEFTRRFGTVFMSFALANAAIAWFSVPYNLILMLLVLAQSLALSMYPTMVKEYDSGRGAIRDTVQRAMRFLFLLSFPIAVGGCLLADPIIRLLYGADYIPAIPVMQILIWSLPFMFLAEILGRACITLHRERQVAWIISINALVTITLTVFLIPTWGVLGAALVIVLNQFINVVLACAIIGWSMLFKTNSMPLVRVVGAGIWMGMGLGFIRDLGLLPHMTDWVALVFQITTGIIIYAIASIVFQAVTPNEFGYLWKTFRHKLNPSD
jgi:O-antigen/teichoic acid export membrane protein